MNRAVATSLVTLTVPVPLTVSCPAAEPSSHMPAGAATGVGTCSDCAADTPLLATKRQTATTTVYMSIVFLPTANSERKVGSRFKVVDFAVVSQRLLFTAESAFCHALVMVTSSTWKGQEILLKLSNLFVQAEHCIRTIFLLCAW